MILEYKKTEPCLLYTRHYLQPFTLPFPLHKWLPPTKPFSLNIYLYSYAHSLQLLITLKYQCAVLHICPSHNTFFHFSCFFFLFRSDFPPLLLLLFLCLFFCFFFSILPFSGDQQKSYKCLCTHFFLLYTDSPFFSYHLLL